MKKAMILSLFAISLFGTAAFAQDDEHAGDIEMWYDDLTTPTELIFEVGESTTDGIALFEAEFENADLFGGTDWEADEPGFDTNPDFGITSGDQIWINILDADAESDFGVGFLNFYNPVTGELESAGDLAVIGNEDVGDLILDGNGIVSGSQRQFIDSANSDNEAHDHLVFDLLDDDSAPGAYGMLFELESHIGGFDGNPELVSDKFWIVINRGMSEEDFESLAVPAFGVAAVPEPASAVLILAGIAALGVKRRRIE